MFRNVIVGLALALLAGVTQAASFDATISWHDNTTNEDGFHVYQDGVLVGTTGPNVTSFVVTGLAEGTSYCFSAEAFNAVNALAGAQVCAATGQTLQGSAPSSLQIFYNFKP